MSQFKPFLNARIVLLAMLCGLVIGFCGYAVDHFVHGINELYTSDLYTCIVASLLCYTLMVYDKRRRVILARRMEIVAEVNHHIRNALTAVVFSAAVQKDPMLQAVIEDATARIDWVLTTILPDGADDLKWPVQAAAWSPKRWLGKQPKLAHQTVPGPQLEPAPQTEPAPPAEPFRQRRQEDPTHS